MSITSREIHLVRRPQGLPDPADFALREVTLPSPPDGHVLVRNDVMSLDPAMRVRMNAGPSYAAAWELDQPATGSAIGEVVESGSSNIPVGTVVLHGAGWREYAILNADEVSTLQPRGDVPVSAYLGALGATGLTAYAGLVAVGEFRAGDRVFVSGAAGAVGSMVGQLARLLGASLVVGSAGSDDKLAALVHEFGFDAGFNYRHPTAIREQLADVAPDGIDLYFDNVGGEHLEAAIDNMRNGGRIAKCGSISALNSPEPPPGPRNLDQFPRRRLTMRGFLVFEYEHLRPEFEELVSPALASGQIVAKETVSQGLESAVDAFIGMLTGSNTGKTLVQLS